MNFDELSPELKEKARACETPEELLALAKQEGIELSEEDLEVISGGMKYMTTDPCPSEFVSPGDL